MHRHYVKTTFQFNTTHTLFSHKYNVVMMIVDEAYEYLVKWDMVQVVLANVEIA